MENVTSHQSVQFSAKTGLGLDLVQAALKEAVRECIDRRPPLPIGKGRAEVRNRLRGLLAKGNHRWLERSAFDKLCNAVGDVSDTEALLGFLHHTGVVFYRKGLFGGRIVLDQNWALEAIYTVFDRQKILPLLRHYGRFSRSDLEILAWSAYSVEEQKVFLGMMESCGICFRAQKRYSDEPEYIAPELLPPWSQAQESLLAGRLLTNPPTASAQAEYGFLHEGVLRNYLSRIGHHAGDAAVYWRYGCWFYEKTTDSRVIIEGHWENAESESGRGSISFRAWGSNASQLIEPLLTEIQRLPIGEQPKITRTSVTEESAQTKDLSTLVITESVAPSSGKLKVFISYAWGDDSSVIGRQRQQVVEVLCQMLESESWEVVRDKTAMRSGDLISTFMKSISRADQIIVVLSDKYLRSPYCMAELYGIYQRVEGEKSDFLEHIIPLALNDAKFGSPFERLNIAEHWQQQFVALEKSLALLGVEDFKLYRTMKKWSGDVGDMLAYVSDVLQPCGFEQIIENDFAGVMEMLQHRRTRSARA